MGQEEAAILSAYAGNSMMGNVIQSHAASIELLVCGHTHMQVREQKLHGVPSLNIGADYGVFRGVTYDTEKKQIQWVGDPIWGR